LDRIYDLGITNERDLGNANDRIRKQIITGVAIKVWPIGDIVGRFVKLTREPHLAPTINEIQRSSQYIVEVRHNGTGVAHHSGTVFTTTVPSFEWISPPFEEPESIVAAFLWEAKTFRNGHKIEPGYYFGSLPPLPVATGFNQFHVPDSFLAKASSEFKNNEYPGSLTIGMEVKLYSTIFRDRKAASIPFYSVKDGPTFTYGEEDLTFTK
jgi:hypothetical protein